MRCALPRRAIGALCFTVMLSACGGSGSDTTSTDADRAAAATSTNDIVAWRTVDIGGAAGVITAGTELGWDVIVGDDGWQPSDADLETFEAALPAALRAEGFDDIADRLDDYTRWYSGLTVGGEPTMLVWFSCAADPADGLDRIPFVDDGGDCFFSAWYDPAAASISRLRVNGEA